MEKFILILESLKSDEIAKVISINKTDFSENLNKLKCIKQKFKEKFTTLINDITEMEDKLENLIKHSEPEESPASTVVKVLIEWETGPITSYVGNTGYTMTTDDGYDDAFRVNIRLIKCSHQSCTIGVSNTPYKAGTTSKTYLGGDFGVGCWAICPSGTYGEDGTWKSDGQRFKEGDILTIEVDSFRVLTYMVNDYPNDYKYQMKILDQPMYIGFSTANNIELELFDK